MRLRIFTILILSALFMAACSAGEIETPAGEEGTITMAESNEDNETAELTKTAQPTTGSEATKIPTTVPSPTEGSEPFVPENPDVMPTDDAEPFVPENPDTMPTEEEPNAEVIPTGTATDDGLEEWYRTLLINAQMNLGNNMRLKNVIERAKAGEKLTVAAIGGSITEGAGATRYKECYAYQTYESFRQEYGVNGGENISFVNAGVGGTPSTFGIMRYERDIVSRVTDEDGLPDIVLVEYAVNDGGEPTNHGCYESLVKYILEQPNHPVVILVFAVFPSGYTLQDNLKKVGTTYNLMMVSIKNGAFPYVGDKWTSEKFFYDIYHPTTLGHKVMADCIFYAIKAAAEEATAAEDINLDVAAAYNTDYVGLKTIFKDDYDEALQLSLGSFTEDDAGAYQNIPIGKVYSKNFYHTSGSEALSFTVTCKNLLLAFRSVNNSAYGKIEVYVDGVKKKTINGNTGSWGQSVTELIFADSQAAEHLIEIRMAEGDEDKKFTITCMGYTE